MKTGNRRKTIGDRKNTKLFGLALAALVFALCEHAEAQQSAKIPKIGWLELSCSNSRTGLNQLRRELRKLGYIEGKNIAVKSRYGSTKVDRLCSLPLDLVRLEVGVLVTPGTNEAIAAENTTKRIPIVSLNLGDPVALGLVYGLARTGGNITGFTPIGPILAAKRVELLKETVSNLCHVAVLWNPKSPSSAQQWKEVELPARELRLELCSMEASTADEFEGGFRESLKERTLLLL